jgi:hypothetical protein
MSLTNNKQVKLLQYHYFSLVILAKWSRYICNLINLEVCVIVLIQFMTYLYVLPIISIICDVKGMLGDIAKVFFFLCSLSKTTQLD